MSLRIELVGCLSSTVCFSLLLSTGSKNGFNNRPFALKGHATSSL